MLVCCSHTYSSPRLEELPGPRESIAPFPGIRTLLSPDVPLHVIWTHGMCKHNDDWVKDRVHLIAVGIGLSTDPNIGSSTPIGIPNPYGRQAYMRMVTFNPPEGRFDITFIVWSPLTEDYKARLDFDAIPKMGAPNDPNLTFPYKRAKLNDALKTGLLNNCLTDAVVYLGPNGDPIRNAMDEGVCLALGGTFQSRRCEFSATDDKSPRLFVTESLGSKFLFDAVVRLANRSDRDPRAAAALASRLESLKAVYMAANQIPLLDQATVGGDGIASAAMGDRRRAYRSSLADFLALRRLRRPEIMPESLPQGIPIITFVDPNDLLTYRLLPDTLGEAGDRTINLIVSNDWTYLGYVERPDNAHCGYSWNPYVVGMIVNGYNGKLAVAPLASATKSCLG
jgi:hypothetical protein